MEIETKTMLSVETVVNPLEVKQMRMKKIDGVVLMEVDSKTHSVEGDHLIKLESSDNHIPVFVLYIALAIKNECRSKIRNDKNNPNLSLAKNLITLFFFPL